MAEILDPLAGALGPMAAAQPTTDGTPMSLTPDLHAWRKQQRETLLAQRMALDREQHARWNAQITARLLAALAMHCR